MQNNIHITARGDTWAKKLIMFVIRMAKRFLFKFRLHTFFSESRIQVLFKRTDALNFIIVV
jgi:hypothetical protein